MNNGGGDNQENISIVSKKKHQAWHLLFGHMEPWDIANEINEVWLDPLYKLDVNRRK